MPNALKLPGLVVLAAAACASDQPAAPASDATGVTYFSGARLIVGDGSPSIADGAFIVADGRFTAVGAASDVAPPVGAARTDLTGKTVMPLLHTLHAHVGYLSGREFAAGNYTRASILDALDRYLYYGVGSVLVLGSDAGDTAFRIREDQRAGRAGGALLLTAGRGITSQGGWPTTMAALADVPYQVTTEAAARDAVQRLAAREVDVVKVWVDDAGGRLPKLGPELYTAVIDEARRHDLSVVAHVFYLDDAKALVRAGVAGLVHSIRDRAVDDEIIGLMTAHDVFYVPTLSAHESAFSYGDRPAWVGEPAMRESVPAAIVDWLRSDEFVSGMAANPAGAALREQYRIAAANLKALSDAGVRIGLGTDSGTVNRFPGYFEHREIELMVAAGLSPAQAITAATRVSAGLSKLARTGTLAAGERADFLVLSGDPLTEITATRRIDDVVRNGRVLDRASLRQRFVGTDER